MPIPATFASEWIVLKFGGTSVSSRARWDTIGALLRERADREGVRVIAVVSALSGITNALQGVIDTHADADACRARIDSIVQCHRALTLEMDLDADAVLGDRLRTLCGLSDDPRRAVASLDWQAEVLAQGELLSSTLGVAYLSRTHPDIGWTDARDWLHAVPLPNQGEWGRWLSVSCASDGIPAAHVDGGNGPRLLVTQGFIARSADGGSAILGRGGSDTSAAYFGAMLRARRVEIWTDVPGMFSANPHQVSDARLLTRLDFEEAQEIATTGAKVLHPRCIHPCRDAGVPIWIRDTGNPGDAGTVIAHEGASTAPGVKAISSRRGIVLVAMETIGMWQQVGFLADIFERFKRHGLSIDLIGSSETNVTVSLDPSDNLVNSNVLEALCADLSEVCRVKVIAPCSAITLVGRGMRSLLHKLSDIWAEFGRERVHLISQSSNDLNLTFVVDESLLDASGADDLLPRLHALLIASGAMPIDEPGVFGPSWRMMHRDGAVRAEPWWIAQREALIDAAVAGTPRYLYRLDTIRDRARALRALGAVDRVHYALKANPHPDILRALAEEGLGFECVSQGELDVLFEALPALVPGRVLFTPNFAPRSEYEAAIQRGVRITLDSVFPLQHWPDLFAGIAIGLRIDPGFGHGHHEKVRTGGKGAKFGLAREDVDAFIALARRAGTRIETLHAHIGSGVFDPRHWRDVYAQLATLADGIGTVSAIDVGGGLGVAYEPDAEPFDLDGFGRALADVKSIYPQHALWIEPGRFLVAEAGVLLLRVTQVIEKEGVRRIGADAGMNALLRPALYGAFHRIMNLSRLHDVETDVFDVVGPICESGDVLGRRRRLPQATAEGDVLLVADTGAYGASMANTYNSRALPVEQVIDAAIEASEQGRAHD